jgi:hypothetical protein
MSSEWMKVMLEEIARKKAESEQARTEQGRREGEQEGHAKPESQAEPQTQAEHEEQAERARGDEPTPPGSGAGRRRG